MAVLWARRYVLSTYSMSSIAPRRLRETRATQDDPQQGVAGVPSGRGRWRHRDGEALAEVSSEEDMGQSQAGGTGWDGVRSATATWGQSMRQQGDCSSCTGAPGERGGHTWGGWRSAEKVTGWSQEAGGPDAEVRTLRGPDLARLTWGASGETSNPALSL